MKQIEGTKGWQHEGNMDRLGYLERPNPSTEIILHILHPATSPLQLIHTHPLPSFSPLPVSSPCHHCTACSLAVLPESWGFITSGSSGGLEKASMCSCSNISSGGHRRQGTLAPSWQQSCRWLHQSCDKVVAVDIDCSKFFWVDIQILESMNFSG